MPDALSDKRHPLLIRAPTSPLGNEVDLNAARSHCPDVTREVAAIDRTLSAPEFAPDGARACTGASATLFGRALRGDDPCDANGGAPTKTLYDDTTLNRTSADRRADTSFGNAV